MYLCICSADVVVVVVVVVASFQAVEYMRQGKDPTEAAEMALQRIIRYYPTFSGGLVAVNKAGKYGENWYLMMGFC